MHPFSQALLQWYAEHKRELPWRDTQEPYPIWLSEIILQQTRVEQGLPYFQRFMERFPTVEAMAAAQEEEVLRLWQGLGYYNRARNMYATAQHIALERAGEWPSSYEGLLQLKGVGPYTAAAIASFVFHEDVAVADGNVFRVLARYFGSEADIATAKGKSYFQSLAGELLPKGHSAAFNSALMEFGALHCRPKKPQCLYCPVQTGCQALARGKIEHLPVKSRKTRKQKRWYIYLVIQQEGQYLMRHRASKGIWRNLYDFPLWEYEKKPAKASIEERVKETLGEAKQYTFSIGPSMKHVLSHRELHIRFVEIDLGADYPPQRLELEGEWKHGSAIEELPKPVPINSYFSKKWKG